MIQLKKKKGQIACFYLVDFPAWLSFYCIWFFFYIIFIKVRGAYAEAAI